MTMNARTRLLSACIIALLGVSPVAFGQEAASIEDLPPAESILDRYIEVTGGAEAYERITSQVSYGSMEMPAAGISGPLVQYMQPDLYYVSIDLAGVGLVESGVKDGIAWESSLLQGPRIKTGDERAQAVRDGTLNGFLYWRDHFSEVETTGVESVSGEPAYRVLMTPNEGRPQTAFYSVESGLVLKLNIVAATPMGDLPLEVVLDDYTDFGGVLGPSTMIQYLAGQAIRITVDSTEENVEIPAEQYDFPSGVEALLN